MKALFLLLIAGPVFAAGGIVTGVFLRNGQNVFELKADQIEFKIAFDSQFETVRKSEEQWLTVIHCSWRNISARPMSMLLKDHDSYHGTLAYPVGMEARVTDSNGKVLTAPRGEDDGWWSSSVLASQISELMPGDIVTIQPGETVVRQFALADLLGGLSLGRSDAVHLAGNAPVSPLVAGTYKIDIRLGLLAAINSLTLDVPGAVGAATSTPSGALPSTSKR